LIYNSERASRADGWRISNLDAGIKYVDEAQIRNDVTGGLEFQNIRQFQSSRNLYFAAPSQFIGNKVFFFCCCFFFF
jgi:hypothetical protein